MLKDTHAGPGRALLAGSVVFLLMFGCTRDPATSGGPVFNVKVKDFKILPSLPSIEDGLVTFRVWNRGPTTHEFVVVQSDSPADELPLAADGLSVDEDTVVPLDELEEVEAGTPGMLTLALVPGRYVLFCNLEGHYLGGMHASIEVTDGV